MFYNPSYMNPIMKGLNQGQPQQQEPLEGIASLAPTQPSPPSTMQPLEGIASLPSNNGFETSFGFLDSDPNRERQYFYNKDLNKLWNMGMGVKYAAPKGFESVTKDQYQDFC